MADDNNIKIYRKYGGSVLLSVIVTFVAVIVAIFVTIKPLLDREKIGSIRGSINTFTNFYIDNTSRFRGKLQDTLNYYYAYANYPDSLDDLCDRIKSVSPTIDAVHAKNFKSGRTFSTDSVISNIMDNNFSIDTLGSILITDKGFSSILCLYGDTPYYIISYPFFNSNDEKFGEVTILANLDYFFHYFSAHNPYADGNLYIVFENNVYGRIRNDTLTVGSDLSGYVLEEYGEKANEILSTALNNPNKEGFITKSRNNYLFAKCEDLFYYVFFYAVDRKYVSHDILITFHILLLLCIIGGLFILRTCLKNMRRLTESARQESRQKKDLEMAASIQRSMLPSSNGDLMTVDVGSCLIPAKGVGGDLYYHLVREGRMYFCIGDISGKGIPASLYMSKTVSLFHIVSTHDYTPSQMASKLNSELCLNNGSGTFLTMFIGILDLKTLKLRYCNAGHDEPVYWDGDTDHSPIFLKTSDNCPIGFDEDTAFTEGSITLSPDFLLVFYTDGINESKNTGSEMFGLDRLLNTVNESRELDAQQMAERTVSEAKKFAGSKEQFDDMTLLVLKHRNSSKSITIGNNRKQLRKIKTFLKDISNEVGLDADSISSLRVGLDEAMTNVVNYAYEGEGTITLEASVEDRGLNFRIIDSGREFNPLEYDSLADDSSERIGGLGISIIKKSFDVIDYRRENGKNILTLTKTL